MQLATKADQLPPLSGPLWAGTHIHCSVVSSMRFYTLPDPTVARRALHALGERPVRALQAKAGPLGRFLAVEAIT